MIVKKNSASESSEYIQVFARVWHNQSKKIINNPYNNAPGSQLLNIPCLLFGNHYMIKSWFLSIPTFLRCEASLQHLLENKDSISKI